MYYIRHYSIGFPKAAEFLDILQNEYRIKCKVLSSVANNLYSSVPVSIVFDLPENHPRIDELDQILPKATPLEEDMSFDEIRANSESRVSILYYPKYSEEERRSAKWLTMRAYTIKPEENMEYNIIGYECNVRYTEGEYWTGVHRIRPDQTFLMRPIKWGRNSFMASLYDGNLLLCNDRTKDILIRKNIKGIYFKGVLKNNMQEIPNINRLYSSYTIPDGALIPTGNSKPYICPYCGMHMIRFPLCGNRDTFAIRSKSLDDSVDFYETLPIFDIQSKKEPTKAYSIFIISQRMYSVLCDNGLEQNIEFIPLDLLDD